MDKKTQQKTSKIVAVRLRPDHEDLLKRAAEDVGLTLSSWLRMVALKAAREQTAQAA